MAGRCIIALAPMAFRSSPCPYQRGLVTHSIARLALAVALLVTACKGSEDGKLPPDSAAFSNADKPGTEVRDACSLITKAEADAIVGSAFDAQPRPRSGETSTCDYVPATGPTGPAHQGFTLKAYWTGGEDAIEVGRKAAGNATSAAGGTGDSVASGVMGLRRVDGLGDEAYFSGRTMSYVRKGDVTLEFQLAGLDNPTPELLRALAKAALARIPG